MYKTKWGGWVRKRRGYSINFKQRRRRRGIRKFILYILIVFIATSSPVLIAYIFNLTPEKEPLDTDKNGDIAVDTTKEMYIPHTYLKKAYNTAQSENISFSKLLTHSAYTANFNYNGYTDEVLKKSITDAQSTEIEGNKKYVHTVYSKVFDDLKVSPLPKNKKVYTWSVKHNKWVLKSDKAYTYTSQNDFGNSRTYGGDRAHEGNDLITDMGTPIVSITDGTVTRLGWNQLGGWRVGVTSKSGTYFYYAHMDRYEDNIVKGQSVKAGDIIGYVGDTGYGPEGTRGNFIPHLHVQIGYREKNSGNYTWFNPYDVLVFLDSRRVTLIEKKK